MDFQELESFLAVARHRSFTRVARELGLAQPTVSRHVQRLERELGAILFERRRDDIELSPAGERFWNYTEGVLAGYRKLMLQMRKWPDTITGELRVAASTTPGEFLVPDLLARFTKVYPDVRPEVFITDSAQVAEELRDRTWDIGFVGVRLPGPGLRYDVVAQDEVVLAVPLDHNFANRGDVELSDLEGQPFLEREGGSGTLRSVRQILSKNGLALPAYRVVMVLSSTQAILSAVERGYGIGWVSSLALRGARAGRVASVCLASVPLIRNLYLVQEKQRPLPVVAAAFAEWVRQEL